MSAASLLLCVVALALVHGAAGAPSATNWTLLSVAFPAGGAGAGIGAATVFNSSVAGVFGGPAGVYSVAANGTFSYTQDATVRTIVNLGGPTALMASRYSSGFGNKTCPNFPTNSSITCWFNYDTLACHFPGFFPANLTQTAVANASVFQARRASSTTAVAATGASTGANSGLLLYGGFVSQVDWAPDDWAVDYVSPWGYTYYGYGDALATILQDLWYIPTPAPSRCGVTKNQPWVQLWNTSGIGARAYMAMASNGAEGKAVWFSGGYKWVDDGPDYEASADVWYTEDVFAHAPTLMTASAPWGAVGGRAGHNMVVVQHEAAHWLFVQGGFYLITFEYEWFTEAEPYLYGAGVWWSSDKGATWTGLALANSPSADWWTSLLVTYVNASFAYMYSFGGLAGSEAVYVLPITH